MVGKRYEEQTNRECGEGKWWGVRISRVGGGVDKGGCGQGEEGGGDNEMWMKE